MSATESDAATGRERMALGRWLTEWNLEQALQSLAAEALELELKGEALGVVRMGASASKLRTGDIRLLHPGPRKPVVSRPVYVVLIEELDRGRFLAAPFGRFSLPALPGEWRTGLRALPVRVLCLWNWREVSGSVLCRSWRAGRMRSVKLMQATSVLRAVRGNRPPDGVASGDIGPPVRHPLDPRLRYQAEEAASFDDQIRALEDAVVMAEAGGTRNWISGEGAAGECLLAAEPKAPYDPGGDDRV